MTKKTLIIILAIITIALSAVLISGYLKSKPKEIQKPVCGNNLCEDGEDEKDCAADCGDGKTILEEYNVYTSAKVDSRTTDEQMDFINRRSRSVLVLDPSKIDKVNGPKKILYRSLIGARKNTNLWDWNHIDSNENMFLHSDESPYPKKRILNAFNEWVTDRTCRC